MGLLYSLLAKGLGVVKSLLLYGVAALVLVLGFGTIMAGVLSFVTTPLLALVLLGTIIVQGTFTPVVSGFSVWILLGVSFLFNVIGSIVMALLG